MATRTSAEETKPSSPSDVLWQLWQEFEKKLVYRQIHRRVTVPVPDEPGTEFGVFGLNGRWRVGLIYDHQPLKSPEARSASDCSVVQRVQLAGRLLLEVQKAEKGLDPSIRDAASILREVVAKT